MISASHLYQYHSKSHQAIKITHVDYADDILILTDTLKGVLTLLHIIEEVSKELGLKINTENEIHQFKPIHHRKAKKPISRRDPESQ